MYRDGNEEAIVCLDAETGETVWESRYKAAYDGLRQYGSGPRSTPLLVGKTLFTVGVTGKMHAVDKSNGTVAWSHDLWGGEFRGNRLEHGYSSSPVAYLDTVIVPVGGDRAGLVAFDQESGSIRWKSPFFKNSYSSPLLVTIAGEEQLIVFMAEELIGVDPGSGELLWRFPHANQWGHNISVPVVDGDRIFISSPQVGARGLQLIREGETTRVEQIWSERRIQFYLATATPERLTVLAEAKLLARPALTVPTIVGQTMYVRDQSQMVAVDLG